MKKIETIVIGGGQAGALEEITELDLKAADYIVSHMTQ